ncbi:MAG: hypothetical protein KME46_24730 [Brasilonema angustatum HA4187-MV1]|jgi:methionine-rich copper-binding protein CopC|nr:hypothetical protein [Brasilonema angustatum HA4187-MV1]
MRKLKLPRWFPYPSSWLNALILSVFMTGLLALIRRSNGLDFNFAKWSDNPELLTILVILVAILPIPAIAFFHHFFISRFIPVIPGEGTINIKGFVPGLISWWESLYSWLVFVLSTLIAILFSTPFLPLFKLNYETIIDSHTQPHKNIQAIFAIFWIISAAIFYQIEYSFKSYLIFADIVNAESESAKTINDAPADVKTDETQPKKTDATEIQKTAQVPTKKPKIVDFLVKNRKLSKIFFTFSLISIVALWVYLFANLPEVQQTFSSASISLEKPLEITRESAPKTKDNTFDRAISKGKIAAQLTKSAQTKDEWQIVLNRWKQAIRLLENVPTSSQDYPMAQQKIIQYQIHREFARQNAVLN